jgi:uncharacterized protein (DUF1778 family)
VDKTISPGDDGSVAAKNKPAILYVYATPEQKAFIEKAAEAEVKGIAGAKVPTSAFVLEGALERAEKVLGQRRPAPRR